jgi:hypothetical protein
MKAGAQDDVLKGELTRLPVAVEKASATRGLSRHRMADQFCELVEGISLRSVLLLVRADEPISLPFDVWPLGTIAPPDDSEIGRFSERVDRDQRAISDVVGNREVPFRWPVDDASGAYRGLLERLDQRHDVVHSSHGVSFGRYTPKPTGSSGKDLGSSFDVVQHERFLRGR